MYQSTTLTEVQYSLELVDRPWKEGCYSARPSRPILKPQARIQSPPSLLRGASGSATARAWGQTPAIRLGCVSCRTKTMCFQLREDLSWRCLACERLKHGQGMGQTAGAKIRKGIRSVEKDVCAAVQRFCVSKLLNETARRLCMALDGIGWSAHGSRQPWLPFRFQISNGYAGRSCNVRAAGCVEVASQVFHTPLQDGGPLPSLTDTPLPDVNIVEPAGFHHSTLQHCSQCSAATKIIERSLTKQLLL